MTVVTMKSDEARSKFRDILDDVLSGSAEVVIERYNKPTAVVVNYHEWQKLKLLQNQQLPKKPEQTAQPQGMTAAHLLGSGLVGIWADRDDIQDNLAFARQLRKTAENKRVNAHALG